MVGVPIKMVICGILLCMIVSEIRHVKLTNCSCEKCLFGELVLAFKYKILNTTETSLNNKKVTFEKNIMVLLTRFHWLLYAYYY